MAASDNNSRRAETWKMIVSVTLAILLPCIGWITNEVLSHRDRLTTIESSRFDEADGQAVWREIASLRQQTTEQLGEIKTMLAKAQVPPEWFLERVALLEERVTAQERAERSAHRND